MSKEEPRPRSRRRRWAEQLMALAVAVVPAQERSWCDGMRHELAWITDDGEALSWAAGALWSAWRWRLVFVADGSPVIRGLAVFYALVWAMAPAWFLLMARAIHSGDEQALASLARHTTPGSAETLRSLLSVTVAPAYIYSMVGVLVLLGATALAARRFGVALGALLTGEVLARAYLLTLDVLQLPGAGSLGWSGSSSLVVASDVVQVMFLSWLALVATARRATA